MCQKESWGAQVTANEGLAQGPTWQLAQDSNPQPSGQKAMNLSMSHQAPPTLCLPPILYSWVDLDRRMIRSEIRVFPPAGLGHDDLNSETSVACQCTRTPFLRLQLPA